MERMNYQEWTLKLVEELPDILPQMEPDSPEQYRAALSKEGTWLNLAVQAIAKVADSYSFEQELRYTRKVEDIESEKSELRTQKAVAESDLKSAQKALKVKERILSVIVKKYRINDKKMQQITKRVEKEIEKELEAAGDEAFGKPVFIDEGEVHEQASRPDAG